MCLLEDFHAISIKFNRFLCKYETNVNNQPIYLVEDLQTYRNTHTQTRTPKYIHMYMYIYICILQIENIDTLLVVAIIYKVFCSYVYETCIEDI